MSEKTLKPCPFCGSDDVAYDLTEGAVAYCVHCGAEGPSMDRASAIEAWNRRASGESDERHLATASTAGIGEDPSGSPVQYDGLDESGRGLIADAVAGIAFILCQRGATLDASGTVELAQLVADITARVKRDAGSPVLTAPPPTGNCTTCGAPLVFVGLKPSSLQCPICDVDSPHVRRASPWWVEPPAPEEAP